MSVTRIQSYAEFRTCLEQPAVIVWFAQDWCGFCQQIEPVVEHLHRKVPVFVKLVPDDGPELAQLAKKHKVTGYPAFLGFKHGKAVTKWKVKGADEGGLEDLFSSVIEHV